jgi:aspartyl-tRNA(Asn)/glutamyl-tRNA(Gln) amidotransferase subunit A
MTLSETAGALASGARTSRELVDRAFALATEDAAAAVFTEDFKRQAAMAADAADLLRSSGAAPPFCGVPVTVKDNIDVAGFVTRAGSRALKDAPPAAADAPVVAKLRRSGFVVLGHTNMTELAFSGLGVNPHFGTPRNPAFADARIPGGSSSGAAVSVALGLSPVAIGTDTGGSIRIPASFCGLVGFKPTAETVSRAGVVPLSTSLDSVGVIGRSVACCALAYGVIANGPDDPVSDPFPPDRFGGARRAQPLAGLRLGVLRDYVGEGLERAVEEAFERSLERLARAGAVVELCPIPELKTIPEIHRHGALPGAEAFAEFREVLGRRGEMFDPRVRARIEAGGRMSAADYIALQAKRRALGEVFRQRTRGFNAILMPTTPVVAPTLESLETDSAYSAVNLLVLRNPTVVNLVGACAISLPCQEPGAPPVGLSLAACAHQDAELLRIAAAVESVLSSEHGEHAAKIRDAQLNAL